MRGAILVLAALLAAEAKDPVKSLPEALRPGRDEMVYDRAAGGGRLDGTATFRVEKGEQAGTVALVLRYDSGDRGVLTFRDRLTAVLDAKARRIVAFEYAVGAGDPLRVAARLRMETDPKKKPGPVHERLTWEQEGEEPRVKTTRPALPDAPWAPEALEPFLVPLLELPEDGAASLALVDVLTGRPAGKPAAYRAIGEGKLRRGAADVPCRILSRQRPGAEAGSLYLRAADHLPVKAAYAFLSLREAAEEERPKEKEK